MAVGGLTAWITVMLASCKPGSVSKEPGAEPGSAEPPLTENYTIYIWLKLFFMYK